MKLNINGRMKTGWRRAKKSLRLRKKGQFGVFVAGCLVFGYVFASCSSQPKNEAQNNADESAANQPENENSLVSIDPNADFSEFKHENPQHQRLPCLLCHKQEENNSPTPKMPGHQPCSGCHVQQFADKQNAICTICHTNAENGDVKRLAKLENFNVRFDHAKHTDQTNCANCHQLTGKGAAMTIVAGANAHSKCFQCHSPETKDDGLRANFCATCHQPGRPNQSVYQAKAFNFKFTHANHKNLNCTNCHTVKAGEGRGRQVSVIATAMHFPPKGRQSCASCHNNKRAFGGDDFSDCRRCHTGDSFKF